jgi:hypothetical protein
MSRLTLNMTERAEKENAPQSIVGGGLGRTGG